MEFSPEQLYHIYNRGNNKQKIFFEEGSYSFFLEKFKKELANCCDILAYSLMPNHFHLMIYTTPEKFLPNKINNQIGIILRSYTRAINKRYNRTGSLFQQKTKCKNLESKNNEYATTCFHYIHQNPYKAGLVENMEGWKFSSFNIYAQNKSSELINKKLAHELLDLPPDSKEFIDLSYNVIDTDYWI